MRSVLGGVVVALITMFMAKGAVAAQKTYVWTEEYATLATGNTELEYYNTAVTHDTKIRNASDWEQKFELEYGISDHLNVSLYQVFEQEADTNSLNYVGYNMEFKYRIGEANQLPIDVLLYAENEVNRDEGNSFEGKVILAKDLGKWNIAYNQIYERIYSAERGEHEYATGVSYEVVPAMRLGIESKGSYSEGEYAAGPTIAWSGGRIWANIGAVFGLNRVTNDREVRFILGVPF